MCCNPYHWGHHWQNTCDFCHCKCQHKCRFLLFRSKGSHTKPDCQQTSSRRTSVTEASCLSYSNTFPGISTNHDLLNSSTQTSRNQFRDSFVHARMFMSRKFDFVPGWFRSHEVQCRPQNLWTHSCLRHLLTSRRAASP